MLYLLTAADLTAVGPGTWNHWKAEIITGLYQKAMQHLAGHSPAVTPDEYVRKRRDAVLAALGPDHGKPWFARQADNLPATYLASTDPEQIAADLRLLHGLADDEVSAHGCFQPEADTLQFTTAAHEEIAPGIFHKLTGALASQGMEILSAEINTLADGLVLDRFRVHDPDYTGQPPPERLAEVERALVASLRAPGAGAPSFRRIWRVGGRRQPTVPVAQNRVQTDNSTSETHTIFDIFAVDRPGLLYAVAQTLFESGLSVSRAKIATYLDQVVDVFYVTDTSGNKIEDNARLKAIRARLLEAIDALEA
jgi:[protein-PII] uridylyltransferase